MFIFKLIASVVVGLLAYDRVRWWKGRSVQDLTIDGEHFQSQVVRSKSTYYSTFRSELPELKNANFDFDLENEWDRFFKRRHLTNEHQVGQSAFDEAIYVRSDSPSLKLVLSSNKTLRDAIAAIFVQQGQWISVEDGLLRVRHDGDQRDNAAAQQAFANLQRALKEISPRLTPGDDRFAAKARWIRAAIIGTIPYAFLTFFEASWGTRTDFIHLDDIVALGTGAAIILLSALSFWITQTLKSSSRGPRILFENQAFLLITGVVAIIGLTADLDRSLDQRPEIIAERVVRSLDSYTTKGRYSHTVHRACFEPAALAGRSVDVSRLRLPDCLNLTTAEYDSFQKGDAVRFHIGRGLFNVPWYKRLERLER